MLLLPLLLLVLQFVVLAGLCLFIPQSAIKPHFAGRHVAFPKVWEQLPGLKAWFDLVFMPDSLLPSFAVIVLGGLGKGFWHGMS